MHSTFTYRKEYVFCVAAISPRCDHTYPILQPPIIEITLAIHKSLKYMYYSRDIKRSVPYSTATHYRIHPSYSQIS